MLQVEHDGVADLLRQRQAGLATALAADGQATVAPIDVGHFELRNLTGP